MAALLVILGLLIDEIILAAVLLWLLPQLGIELPVGVVAGILVAVVGFPALIYKPVKRALGRRVSSGPEAMVGKRGTAITDIAPRGQVRLQGEVWNAVSSDKVRASEEVIVSQTRRLELTVHRAQVKVTERPYRAS